MAASTPESPASDTPPSPNPAATPRGFARRHWGKLTLLTLLGLPALGVTVWSLIALTYTYSSGTRTGYLLKLSEKGWICKTWEGELAMATAPGVAPEKFIFTVRNDSLASAITEEIKRGRSRVALEYREHRGVPTSCFGDTPYFVEGFSVVQDDDHPPLP